MPKMLYEKAYIDAIAAKIRSLVPDLWRRKFTTAEIPDGIQRVYEQGKTDGHSEGYSNGYNEGYKKGYSGGKTSGHKRGYDEGYDKGLVKGIDLGETSGYSNGYKDGAEQAIKSIPRAEGVGF